MKAALRPLHGKYYGTRIELTSNEESVEFANDITIWVSGGKPSQRQLVQWEKEGRSFDVYDEHYESAHSFDLAMTIIAALNKE